MSNAPVAALSVLLPSAVTLAPLPTKLSTFLVTMGTPTDAPMPTDPPPPMEPATLVSSSASLAEMAMLCRAHVHHPRWRRTRPRPNSG